MMTAATIVGRTFVNVYREGTHGISYKMQLLVGPGPTGMGVAELELALTRVIFNSR